MATEEEVREMIMQFPVGHPLRRTISGPSDIEWALLNQRVIGMEKSLEKLVQEVQKSNEMNANRCASCAASDASEDHEDRLRVIEQGMWKLVAKAAAATAIVTALLTTVLK